MLLVSVDHRAFGFLPPVSALPLLMYLANDFYNMKLKGIEDSSVSRYDAMSSGE